MEKRETRDPRIERTRDLLWKALVDRIQASGYAAVTVRDVAHAAGVNRATLYRHYEDKDDLLRRGTARFVNALIEKIGNAIDAEPDLAPATVSSIILLLLRHLDRDRRTFQVMLRPDGNPEFSRIAQDMLFEFLLQRRIATIPRRYTHDPLTNEIHARMVTSSLISVIVWWIAEDRGISAESLAGVYSRFVLLGITGSTQKRH